MGEGSRLKDNFQQSGFKVAENFKSSHYFEETFVTLFVFIVDSSPDKFYPR